MHIVVCQQRHGNSFAIKAFFAIALASLVGLSGVMNGMILAEETHSTSNSVSTASNATDNSAIGY